MVQPQQIIGPYTAVRKIGAGGMGEVFEAVHSLIGRRVAIKVLHPEYAQRADVVARFFNEARAVNRVAHPGLVQISDYGQLDDQSAYIVMEFLQGETLSKRILHGPTPLPLGTALSFAFQLADSLAAAHAKDVIHRDLKPDNVMIVTDSQAPGGERTKLLDFGIAKVTDDIGQMPVRTRTGAIMGTPHYMSPEQCRGAGQVDGRSDTYSLGVMLYEMLSGERPITGQSHGEIIANHLVIEPMPLVSKMPQLPSAVTDLVASMLCKNRDLRPPMAKVVEALDGLCVEHPPPVKRRLTANVPKVSSSAAVATLPPPPSVVPATPAPPHVSLVPATTLPPPADPPPAAGTHLDPSAGAAETSLPAPRPEETPVPPARGAQLLQQSGATLRQLGATLAGLAVRRDRRLALGVAVLVALLAFGTLAVRWGRGPRELPAAQPVRLTVRSTPPGADVVRVGDGALLGRTPWLVQQPAGAGLLKLRLHLSGHTDQELALDLSHDSVQDVSLQAQAPAPPPEAPAAEAPHRRKSRSHGSHPAEHENNESPADGKKHHHHKAAPKGA